MYDFANSGYTTVVITAVFSAYFVAEVAGDAPWATFAWTAALAVSYALIMLTAPLLGAWADAHAAKKRLLAATTIGCVLFTAALALVGRGDVGLAITLIILSNFFFGSGENLIAAFLPEIARGEALGRISGWGWGLGYLGGLVALGLCLAYVSDAQAAGSPATVFVPVTMLLTAMIFALASLPTNFQANRNPLSGELNTCLASLEGGNCLGGALGSVRSPTFRSRGVAASLAPSSRVAVLSYDPQAPFASADGLVASPNVDVVDDMMQLATARYSFAANLAVIHTADDMTNAVLDMRA